MTRPMHHKHTAQNTIQQETAQVHVTKGATILVQAARSEFEVAAKVDSIGDARVVMLHQALQHQCQMLSPHITCKKRFNNKGSIAQSTRDRTQRHTTTRIKRSTQCRKLTVRRPTPERAHRRVEVEFCVSVERHWRLDSTRSQFSETTRL